MIKSNSPKKLWDDCLELEMEIRSCTANNVFAHKGKVPRTVMNGETANITLLCEFGWYDWVYFRDYAVTYPDDKWVLGRWLEPSTDIGLALCAKILKENGRCVYRSSYRHLTEDEVNSPEERKKTESYDQIIYSKLRSSASTQDFEEDYSTPEYELYEDDDGDGIVHAKECDDVPTPITYDIYIGAEVFLPNGNDMVSGTVMLRVKDFEGQPIGKADKNPVLDTRVYNEFSDCENAELGANIIAECMYAQCDNTGLWMILLTIGRITTWFAKITKMLQ